MTIMTTTKPIIMYDIFMIIIVIHVPMILSFSIQKEYCEEYRHECHTGSDPGNQRTTITVATGTIQILIGGWIRDVIIIIIRWSHSSGFGWY